MPFWIFTYPMVFPVLSQDDDGVNAATGKHRTKGDTLTHQSTLQDRARSKESDQETLEMTSSRKPYQRQARQDLPRPDEQLVAWRCDDPHMAHLGPGGLH